MNGIIIGFLIGIIAYTLLYLGKGIQKYSIEGLKKEKSWKNSLIWTFGTVLTTLYMFIQWIALLYAPINIIAPLDAFGLIILIIFSYYILKERIIKIGIVGILLISLGTIMIPLFNNNPSDIQLNDFSSQAFTIIFSVIVSVELVAFSIAKLRYNKYLGVNLSILAGTFMAFQTVTKRITAIPDAMITLIFTFITFIMAALTLIFTQYAFTKAKANLVVPFFTSTNILIAIFTGIIALNELINYLQIVGIILIIGGNICLTAFKN